MFHSVKNNRGFAIFHFGVFQPKQKVNKEETVRCKRASSFCTAFLSHSKIEAADVAGVDAGTRFRGASCAVGIKSSFFGRFLSAL